jgi:hypothetical protein
VAPDAQSPLFQGSIAGHEAERKRVFENAPERATMKLEHRRGRGTIHHGDLGITLDRFDRAARPRSM